MREDAQRYRYDYSRRYHGYGHRHHGYGCYEGSGGGASFNVYDYQRWQAQTLAGFQQWLNGGQQPGKKQKRGRR